MITKYGWLGVGAFACCLLLHLATPPTAQANRWEVRREIRQGIYDVQRAKRRAALRVLSSDSRSEARREIRRGIRNVERARRRARRDVRREIIDSYYDRYYYYD